MKDKIKKMAGNRIKTVIKDALSTNDIISAIDYASSFNVKLTKNDLLSMTKGLKRNELHNIARKTLEKPGRVYALEHINVTTIYWYSLKHLEKASAELSPQSVEGIMRKIGVTAAYSVLKSDDLRKIRTSAASKLKNASIRVVTESESPTDLRILLRSLKEDTMRERLIIEILKERTPYEILCIFSNGEVYDKICPSLLAIKEEVIKVFDERNLLYEMEVDVFNKRLQNQMSKRHSGLCKARLVKINLIISTLKEFS